MKKKGHLTLVDSTFMENVELIQLSPQKTKASSTTTLSVQQRLANCLKEIQRMRDQALDAVVDFQLRPLAKIKMVELENALRKMTWDKSQDSIYELEVKRISNEKLSPFESKQLVKVQNSLKQVRLIWHGAGKDIEELIELKKRSNSVKPTKGKKVKSAQPNGMQLLVKLDDAAIPIWRRLQVPGDCSFAELHFTIQNSFGWEDDHLHRFKVRGEYVSDSPDDHDEEEYTLEDFSWRRGSKFQYYYDFGDNWTHTIEIEKTLDAPHNVLECMDGRGKCPPEDCGGIDAYNDMLKIIKNPKHPEYEEVVEWLGEDFDPNDV